MIVYRVEDRNERGPYAGCDRDRFPGGFQGAMDALGQGHTYARHEVEGYSESARFGAHAKWGFESMESLRRWFDYFGDHGYDTLREHGYKVGVYEVPDDEVLVFTMQVVFNRLEANHLRDEEV